jgi:hypothetical protein
VGNVHGGNVEVAGHGEHVEEPTDHPIRPVKMGQYSAFRDLNVM